MFVVFLFALLAFSVNGCYLLGVHAVTSVPCICPWSVLYDVLRHRGLSLLVVVDCLDTVPVAEMLHRQHLLSTLQLSILLSMEDPLHREARSCLVNFMSALSPLGQDMFAAVLIHHQPYLLELSAHYWEGPNRKLVQVIWVYEERADDQTIFH